MIDQRSIQDAVNLNRPIELRRERFSPAFLMWAVDPSSSPDDDDDGLGRTNVPAPDRGCEQSGPP
jgi:hypothetical protein